MNSPHYDDILEEDFDVTNNGSEALNSAFNKSLAGGFNSNTSMAYYLHKNKCKSIADKYVKLSLNRMSKRRPKFQNRRLAIQGIVVEISLLSNEQQTDALITTMRDKISLV